MEMEGEWKSNRANREIEGRLRRGERISIHDCMWVDSRSRSSRMSTDFFMREK
jgi:hypothetical protein